MEHILEYSPRQLEAWFAARGAPRFRAAQVRRWLFERRVGSFDEMTDLSKADRTALAEHFQIWSTEVAVERKAADGTIKLVLALHDGQRIECVLIREAPRLTVCVSTQVGCGMGCVFCASGLDGVVRNLTSGEIIEQLLRVARLLPAQERISHIVVMGMGEPLANLRGLLPALAEASDPAGLGISARRITISTVGLPRGIARLAADKTLYHLAISLHAPNDELRNQLVPINGKTGLPAILTAADEYFRITHRRLTFEYVLLAGINDRPEHAQQLVALLRGRPMLLNVIPYNPVAGLPYRTPTAQAIGRFRDILETGGLAVRFRQRKGAKIDAACGQLRRGLPEPVTL